jgi:hypothetical protein
MAWHNKLACSTLLLPIVICSSLCRCSTFKEDKQYAWVSSDLHCCWLLLLRRCVRKDYLLKLKQVHYWCFSGRHDSLATLSIKMNKTWHSARLQWFYAECRGANILYNDWLQPYLQTYKQMVIKNAKLKRPLGLLSSWHICLIKQRHT